MCVDHFCSFLIFLKKQLLNKTFNFFLFPMVWKFKSKYQSCNILEPYKPRADPWRINDLPHKLDPTIIITTIFTWRVNPPCIKKREKAQRERGGKETEEKMKEEGKKENTDFFLSETDELSLGGQTFFFRANSMVVLQVVGRTHFGFVKVVTGFLMLSNLQRVVYLLVHLFIPEHHTV